MEELFKELAWTCYQNDCRFEYIPQSNGVLVQDDAGMVVSAGWLEDDVSVVLNRMHGEVNEFLEIESMEDTEFKTDNLTSYERNMKLSGHKESDFE